MKWARRIHVAVLAPLAAFAASPRAQPADSSAAEGTHTLDVTDRHITRDEWSAQMQAQMGHPGSGVLIRAGADVRARGVDLHLRGVRGLVHFRADLAELHEALGTRPPF